MNFLTTATSSPWPLVRYVIFQSALLASAQQLTTTIPIIVDQTTVTTTQTTTVSSSSSSSTSGVPSGYSTLIQPIAANASNPNQDVLQWIDPLIGTALGGHVFAGATLPFGMAKAVADVYGENQGGFASDSNTITGFSHMHDSGTGGSPSLGNFPIWAHPSCPQDDYKQCTYQLAQRSAQYYADSVVSKPGYFSIKTNNNITTETTVTNHTALYRMTFDQPTDGQVFSPLILLSLADLPNTRTNGAINIDPQTGRMMGNGTFQPSFGIGNYNSFFCLDLQARNGAKVRDSGVWFLDRVGEATNWRVVPDGVNAPNMGSPGIQGGGWVRSNGAGGAGPGNPLLVRVGMSFISTAQACSNAEKEIPTFDFDGVRSAAESAWREKLSVVSVDATGVSPSLQHTFWSGLYRTMISPQDYTGENPLWQSTEPYYDSFYCIWDSFRGIHQLLTIVDPVSQTRMIRALIDIYRHEGYLPDCRMSLCKGFTQGGSNADTLLVDSYLKGISDGVNWTTGYEALIKDAEVEPLNWAVEGRGGLESWKTLGYIPSDDFDVQGVGPFTRSISRTAEYAYNDYSIAILANLTGKLQDYTQYLARSNNWKNLYNPHQTSSLRDVSSNITGYLQPKLTNGAFEQQDPFLCSPHFGQDSCYLNPTGTETYEGSPWLYTFYVPQDMASLITILGGSDAFVNRLDYYHENVAYIGDEQAFLPVWQYHYAGRPGLSTKRAHSYIPSSFNASLNGIPGNDDSGAMGAFPVLSMMGTWPVQGQNVYLLSPPFFPSISITSRVTGKIATMKVKNFDASGVNIYPQSVTLNGVPYTKNWITHDFFLNGGVLEWTVGPNESDWGRADADLPPSQSTTGFVGKVKT